MAGFEVTFYGRIWVTPEAFSSGGEPFFSEVKSVREFL
jgi:hypothetical protein